MNLLNRYLFGHFLKYFFTVNAGFVSIYLLVDFFEKIDDFKNGGKSMGLALQYFFLTIPYVVNQLGPVFILLAGVISLGMLNHSNELNALKAGGIPLRLIIRPLLSGSVVVTILFLASAEFLLPVTISQTNSIWYEELKGRVPLGITRNARYYYKGQNGYYSFLWTDYNSYKFDNFSYSQWDENYNVKTLTTAKTAGWMSYDNTWILQDGQIQEKQGKEYTITNFEEKGFEFPEKPEDFLVPVNEAAERSLTERYQAYEDSQFEYERNAAWTNFLGKISYLVLGLPLLLIGLPILLYSYRKWGRDLSVAIPASCGLAFIAWGGWSALQSLAIAGHMSPVVAGVALHIIFAVLGFFLLVKNDR